MSAKNILNALEKAINMGHKHLIVSLCEELDAMTLSKDEQTKYNQLIESL